MIGRIEQIFQHEAVSAAAGVLNQNQYSATTWGSDRYKYIPWEGESFLLVVTTDAAVTGTTPSLTVAVQVSDNGGAYAAPTGGAVTTAAIATATTSVIVAPAGTGFMSNFTNPPTHTYNIRVLITSGAADNVETGLSVFLVFLV